MNSISIFLISSLLRIDEALAAFPESPIKPPQSIGSTAFGPRALSLACTGLSWLFTAAIIFSIVMALLAAIGYMRAAGDPGKVKESTNKLIFTAIGIAVAIVARTVPIFVGSLVGVSGGTDIGAICPGA